MSSTRLSFPSFSRWTALLFAGLMIIGTSGCQYFIVLGYLIGGPPQIQPLFEAETNQSFTDRNVKVAVVCYAPPELKKFHDNIDHALCRRLTAMLKLNHIEVIDPDQILGWIANHPDWDSAVDVGANFDCNYVVSVDISEFSLYEKDSPSLFRGRCDSIVSVYEMSTDGDGDRIFTKAVSYTHLTLPTKA